MTRRSVILVSAILTIVLAAPSSAFGGGWWTSIDANQHMATGQKFEFVTKQLLFQSIEEAELAESETFYAYLLQNIDQQMLREATSKEFSPDWWDPTGARAIKVGTVRVSGSQSNLTRATAHIDLTGVEPGNYSLMFCDAGCEHALADLVPTEITVVEDPLLARVANKVTDMRWRISEIKWEVSNRIRQAARQSADRADVKTLDDQVEKLQTVIRRTDGKSDLKNRALVSRVSALEDNSTGRWLSLLSLLLGIFIGGVIAVLLVRRERRRLSMNDGLEMERELLKLQ